VQRNLQNTNRERPDPSGQAGVSAGFHDRAKSADAIDGRKTWSVPISLCWTYLIRVPKRYSLYTMLSFEFDERKSQINRRKHGIDFVDAQLLWLDPDLLEIPAKTVDETRYLIIGRILDTHWSAVTTYRDENIRIISVRRSRDEEIKLYES
jgi:uncharacterized DUF497 family protein